jgi:hypothetical protein
MSKDDERQPAYAHKIHEENKKFSQDLLTENEKLRAAVAVLQSEKREVEDEIRGLRTQLEERNREQVQLRRQLYQIEADSHKFSSKYVELEQQTGNLLNLYVASYRLHGTLDRKEVLATIQEIITNLIGSEEIAVYEMDAARGGLDLTASFGIDAARHARVPLGQGIIGRAAESGQIFIAGSGRRGEGQERDLTACIPLKVQDRVIGVIAIFRLLQQKPGLESVDHELFELLATHAAMALYTTLLHGAAARS